jgi:phosphate acetyltransferase
VVVAGERSDIVLVSGLVDLQGMPLAGLLLTCASKLTPQVATLLGGPGLVELPILTSDQDTYKTAALLGDLSHDVCADDTERMDQVLTHAAEHIDTTALLTHIGRADRLRMSPPAFRHRMVQAARAANKRIVLPEGDEPRTVQAAAICHLKGIARCVLLGEPGRIRQIAQAQGVALPDQVEIIDPAAVRGRYVEPMTVLRRAKGLTALQAEQQLEDNVVARHDDVGAGRRGRTGFRGCAYNRQHNQAGAAVDPNRAGRDDGIERVLHVDAQRGAGLWRLCRQPGSNSRGTG